MQDRIPRHETYISWRCILSCSYSPKPSRLVTRWRKAASMCRTEYGYIQIYLSTLVSWRYTLVSYIPLYARLVYTPLLSSRDEVYMYISIFCLAMDLYTYTSSRDESRGLYTRRLVARDSVVHIQPETEGVFGLAHTALNRLVSWRGGGKPHFKPNPQQIQEKLLQVYAGCILCTPMSYRTDLWQISYRSLTGDLCALKGALYTLKRALNTSKRALNTSKRALNTSKRDIQKPESPVYTCKRPTYTQKRPVYTQKRYANTQKRPVHTQVRPVYARKSPVYTQKSPIYTQESPVYNQRRPIFTQTRNKEIYTRASHACLPRVTSSVYIYIYIYVCICIRLRVPTSVYIYAYICIYTYIYVCMYI